MKTKSLFLGLGLFFSATLFGQQLGSGMAPIISNYDVNVPSGFYATDKKQTGFPDFWSPDWLTNYTYLINVSRNDPTPHQWQIATPWVSDDRMFFRKLYPTTNSGWHEIATRGVNTFVGNQKISGDMILASGSNGTGALGYGQKLYFGQSWENNDDIYFARYNIAHNTSELHLNLGDAADGGEKFIIGSNLYTNNNKFTPFFVVQTNGRVGIGVAKPENALDVNGTIRAKEVRVESGWADFVFDKSYTLPTLDEVKAHIDEHKHLPGIPSEAEVKENGIGLSEISTKLLQKVEELTLYVIQQNEKVADQQKTINELNSRIKNLEKTKK